MARREAVLALRQQIVDAGFAVGTDRESGDLARTAARLDDIHFVTTGGDGNVRVLMSANRRLLKLAIRPGSMRRRPRAEVERVLGETLREAESTLRAALASLPGAG